MVARNLLKVFGVMVFELLLFLLTGVKGVLIWGLRTRTWEPLLNQLDRTLA